MQTPDLYRPFLDRLGIDQLNPMQLQALAAQEAHASVLLLSATGSGKTLAYLLPLLSRIDRAVKSCQALIVVPSRELAQQIESVFRNMGTGMKITACYGGHKREIEENNLLEAPHLIVGTPGRLADHLRRGNFTADSIRYLVLDEFDKILEMGFVEELEEIISQLTSLEARTLTSATQSASIPDFLNFQQPAVLDFLPDAPKPAELFDITWLRSESKDKLETLFSLICHIGDRSAIIFCNHREAVERVNDWLQANGIHSVFYHGAMEQRDRELALHKFRNGSVRFLVTTDLASRGLDVTNIRFVIHYHLPTDEAAFTHRNGRTARMDNSGTAVLLLHEDEKIPPYLREETVAPFPLRANCPLPEKTKWTTLYVAAGKKNKINKVDIVGFLCQQGELKPDDIGLISVGDFSSFVAVRRNKVTYLLQQIKDQKLKNKKIRVEVAK